MPCNVVMRVVLRRSDAFAIVLYCVVLFVFSCMFGLACLVVCCDVVLCCSAMLCVVVGDCIGVC